MELKKIHPSSYVSIQNNNKLFVIFMTIVIY